ncbi:hypothetical protein [Yinghuangia soli]|uniref:Uncharacterized protein n=1 Tax=Yinghuangia soli TaxID=2908204 RepID=A0AA41Q7S7_9ACTN|nr:hypothetical protein [Yinghuangia soli]MCF2531747.1 hypothetical protein [Yinghuangia soli]
MPRPTYATYDDYIARPGAGTPPDDIEQRLTDASRRLDRFLISAVYDVGTDGAPIDADVAEAFAVATCEIARSELRADDGDDGRTVSVTAGPVSMTRSGPDLVLAGEQLPNRALDVLGSLPCDVFRLGVITGACSW